MINACVCVDTRIGCERSCCIGLQYNSRRSPHGAKRVYVLAFYTFGVARDVFPSKDSLDELVCAVVLVSRLLFVLRRQSSIVREATRNGGCETQS